MNRPCILIPAYQPDEKLLDLIDSLLGYQWAAIVLVNDGSRPTCQGLFDQAEQKGCIVIRHAVNLGKGRALKSGLNEIVIRGLSEQGVITADADGQHRIQDILRVSDALKENPDSLVLGVRHFTGTVPWRSRLGNGLTRMAFALIHGHVIYDTQTGLRGLPVGMLPFLLSLAGERYEYEMNMLLAAKTWHRALKQVPIETIYLEGNRSSHYRALQDSARIFGLLIRFTASSLLSAALDFLVFALLLHFWPQQLLSGVIIARVFSSFFNYMTNRHLVFHKQKASPINILRYYLLVVVIMLASYGGIRLLSAGWQLPVLLSKVLVDGLLYGVSFIVQRDWVHTK